MTRILESNRIGPLLRRKAARLEEAEAVVRPILAAVRKNGDKALLEGPLRHLEGLDVRRRFDGDGDAAAVSPGHLVDEARRSVEVAVEHAVDARQHGEVVLGGRLGLEASDQLGGTGGADPGIASGPTEGVEGTSATEVQPDVMAGVGQGQAEGQAAR